MKYPYIFIFLISTVFFPSIAKSQAFEEISKAVASDRDIEDRFGWSVDISGDYAISGAYADDFGGADPNMGSAYIFQKIDGEWIEIQKIFNSDQDDYDRFGWSVAIDGEAGYAVIGAYGEDHNIEDGASLSKAGSAYIFERDDEGVWNEVQKIVAFDRAADDEFGWSVAIHGSTLVVGAHIDDKDEDGLNYMYHAGSAYIYDRAEDTEIWEFSQKIVAPDRSPGFEYADDHEDWNDRFGEHVAIWNDYLVVGGPYASKAYVFERVDDVWTNEAYLTYPGISWLDRASAVDIDSTTIILGAYTEDLNADGEESIMNSGGAMIYTRGDFGWSLLQKISPEDRDAGDHFGISVAIDLPYIVVGTHSDNHDEFGDDEIENTGSAYIFELQEDGFYTQFQKIDAADRTMDDEYGISVGISQSTIVVGAFQQDTDSDLETYLEDAGAIYFHSNEIPVIEPCVTIYFSQSVTICAGESITVGENNYSESGTYTDSLLTELACDSIVTTSLTVTEAIEIEQEYNLCAGESVTIDGETFETTSFYIGEYVTDAGCDSTVFYSIFVASPIDTDVNAIGSTLSAEQDDASYQWIKCEPYEIIDGATDQSYISSEDGLYAVILTIGICSDTSSCVEVNTIGITEHKTEISSFTVFPNPTNGLFSVKREQAIPAIIQIYNTLGQEVFETTFNEVNTLISVSDLTPGIYIIHLTDETGTKTKKITIN